MNSSHQTGSRARTECPYIRKLASDKRKNPKKYKGHRKSTSKARQQPVLTTMVKIPNKMFHHQNCCCSARNSTTINVTPCTTVQLHQHHIKQSHTHSFNFSRVAKRRSTTPLLGQYPQGGKQHCGNQMSLHS